MKALVTGAGEYLGSHLVRRLLEDGHEVLAIGRMPHVGWLQYDNVAWWNASLSDGLECYKVLSRGWALSGGEMDWIFHISPGCPFYSGTITDFNLIDAARERGVSNFLYLSSTSVYPPAFADDIPFDESDVYPALPADLDGWQKLHTEHLLKHYNEQYNMKTYILRPCECYGVGYNKGIVFELCKAIAEQKLKRTKSKKIKGGDFNGNTISYLPSDISISLPVPSTQVYSLLHVDDCVEAMVRLIQTEYHDPITLVPSREVTAATLADLIGLSAGVNVIKTYVGDSKVQNMHFSNKKCLEVLGWTPDYSLEKGIEEVYRWVEGEMKSE